ncbi:MAG: peptidogalycan biosysnthesis protein [Thiogranum sp.]
MQGIDYCIEHGLRQFEPGARGEHKISRGFLPVLTWSVHWIQHEGFSNVIARFLRQEAGAMRDYMTELLTHSPFRQSGVA